MLWGYPNEQAAQQSDADPQGSKWYLRTRSFLSGKYACRVDLKWHQTWRASWWCRFLQRLTNDVSKSVHTRYYCEAPVVPVLTENVPAWPITFSRSRGWCSSRMHMHKCMLSSMTSTELFIRWSTTMFGSREMLMAFIRRPSSGPALSPCIIPSRTRCFLPSLSRKAAALSKDRSSGLVCCFFASTTYHMCWKMIRIQLIMETNKLSLHQLTDPWRYNAYKSCLQLRKSITDRIIQWEREPGVCLKGGFQ